MIQTDDRNGSRYITLNRPEKRNAMDAQMVQELSEAVRAAAAASEVKAVVVNANGPMFSSGMDLAMLASLAEQPQQLRPFRQLAIDTYNLLEQMTKPTIAVMHGGCIGGALELALSCDLRISTENTVFCLPETKVGLLPDLGGSSRLPAVVGLGRAKEMIMTSRLVGAQEAKEIGLVNRICKEDELQATTEALLEELAGCSPLAVGLAKRVMDASAKPALAVTLEQEVTSQQVLIGSDDFAEGTTAARERRAANFKGR